MLWVDIDIDDFQAIANWGSEKEKKVFLLFWV